ncbi:ABC transporter substrate-binding protein [Pseudonocardia lacus]|uniref:ABC transporter substrate-binding protein n=1 Tax=Pseudonocardia lacus TaxID=2835865 RepID=UPI001BDC237B|nr:ABC transporter substrate-binding protein [Pseudonocardia lacus]
MRAFRIVAVAAAAVVLAGCTTSAGHSAPPGADVDLSGQRIEVAAVWSDDEQASFERVLDEFERQTGAEVTYVSGGDELPTVLSTRLVGGAPPDVAIVSQPALVHSMAVDGALVPLDAATDALISEQFRPVWKEWGTVDGTLYGFVFKASNKSTVWYDADQLGEDFVPPADWDAFIDLLRTRSDIGGAPLSVGGADGWTLTDWFENVYLQTAGAQMYDKLAEHEIPWTHDSVRVAMETLGRAFQPQFMPGGRASALQTEFADSVVNVFGDDPKAEIVFEADFVAGVIAESTSATVGQDALFFPFPSVGDTSSVITGGDTVVALTDRPATTALVRFLASSQAADIWVERGGFISPNREVELDGYPDETTRRIADDLVNARNVRFDMSDLMPTSLGATRGDGFWRAMQDYLGDPDRLPQILSDLEAEAGAAYARR